MKNTNNGQEGFFATISPTIVERLPVVMAVRKMNTRELAQGAGTQYANLSRIMRGKGQFKASQVVGICNKLNFSVDGLTGSKHCFAYNVSKILK